jgi:hypothetical protein
MTCAILLALVAATLADVVPTVLVPPSLGSERDVAVLINLMDPYSLAVGEYYAKRRNVPKYYVQLPLDDDINITTFLTLQTFLAANVSPQIQGYALAWRVPMGVTSVNSSWGGSSRRMSLTSALALGFDPKWFTPYCTGTATSPYGGGEKWRREVEERRRGVEGRSGGEEERSGGEEGSSGSACTRAPVKFSIRMKPLSRVPGLILVCRGERIVRSQARSSTRLGPGTESA